MYIIFRIKWNYCQETFFINGFGFIFRGSWRIKKKLTQNFAQPSNSPPLLVAEPPKQIRLPLFIWPSRFFCASLYLLGESDYWKFHFNYVCSTEKQIFRRTYLNIKEKKTISCRRVSKRGVGGGVNTQTATKIVFFKDKKMQTVLKRKICIWKDFKLFWLFPLKICVFFMPSLMKG